MRHMRGGSLMVGYLLLAAAHPSAAQTPAARADSSEMPAASTLVLFWARGWSGGAWQFGRVATIMDSRQAFCPVVKSGEPASPAADSIGYLVRSIDSLQVVDSAAAKAGRPMYRTVAMAPIKRRYGSCGVPQ
jgi:hypothetical protein